MPNAQSKPLPIAVIGAGITGLTAAWRLQQNGLPVTVYEGAERPGGVIRSHRQGEYLAEYGPNTMLETSPRITELIREAGLAGRRLDSDPRAPNRYVVRGGQPVPLPLSPVSFFASRLFSVSAKLRLFVEPFIGRGTGEETVAAFVRRRLGQEFLDYAIDPLVSGIYAGDPEQLSVSHAFPKVQALEARYGSLIRGQIFGARERRRRAEVSKANAPKLSFDEGLQVLPDTLAAHLGNAVRLNTTVMGLSRDPAAWTVRFVAGGGQEQAKHAAVLFAGTAYQLSRLQLAAGRPMDLAPLGQIHYPPVASVVLGFRREQVPHPLDGFGMLVPGVEGFKILGTIFSSSLFSRRAPDGHVTLTTYLGGAKHPELARQSPEILVDQTLKDLRAILRITGPPTYQFVSAYPQAIPQYVVGYGRFKDLLDAAEKEASGLFFAGHYRHGVSLSDSILSALDTADRVLMLNVKR